MEDRVEIPESFWERLVADKRKLAYVVGGALLVLALVVFGVVKAVGGRDPQAPPAYSGNETPGGSGSSEETSSAEETRSSDATGAPTDGDAGEPSEGSGSKAAAFVSKPFVAYRKDGTLWVANEDGTGAVKVVAAPTGTFALSPDATTLAYVDPASTKLTLVPVVGGAAVVVGPALDASLAWAPDSSAVAYSTRSGSANQVRTVKRAGGPSTVIGSGHSPRYSADAAAIVWISDAAYGQPGTVAVQRVGSAGPPSLSPDLRATEAAFSLDGVVAVVTGSTGTSKIMAEELGPEYAFAPSTRARELSITLPQDRPVTIAHLCPSVSDRYLSYTVAGDDGYSRVSVYDADRDSSASLSVRRDTYPLCWSSDGRRVFVVEGNAFQGEPTAVLSVMPDGMGRSVIAQGGGL